MQQYNKLKTIYTLWSNKDVNL